MRMRIMELLAETIYLLAFQKPPAWEEQRCREDRDERLDRDGESRHDDRDKRR